MMNILRKCYRNNIQKLLVVVCMNEDDEIIVNEEYSFIGMPSEKNTKKQHTPNNEKHVKNILKHACNDLPH